MSADEPIRILACDDSSTADADLAALLEHAGSDGSTPLRLVGLNARMTNATTAIARGVRTQCDVILVDLVMPKTDNGRAVYAAPWIARALTTAFEARRAEQAAQGWEPPAMVMWTSNPAKTASGEVRAFMHHGGHQVIDKQASVKKQVERIRSAAAGRDRLVFESDDVTDREREVLSFAAEGFSQDEIARRLVITTKSVQGYVANLRHKLGVRPEHGRGGGVLRAAAEAAGVTFVPAVYLEDPGSDPLSLAH